jgi:hypothetical protein
MAEQVFANMPKTPANSNLSIVQVTTTAAWRAAATAARLSLSTEVQETATTSEQSSARAACVTSNKAATQVQKLADRLHRAAKKADLPGPDLGVQLKQEEGEEEEIDLFKMCITSGVSHMLGEEYFGGRYCI